MNHYYFTLEILKRCKKFGYEIVTIGKWDKHNPSCLKYNHWKETGPHSLYCHPYTKGSYKGHIGGGPYSILESMDSDFATPTNKLAEQWDEPKLFQGGCGNGGIQAQILSNAPLIIGTYILDKDYLEALGTKFMIETDF